ncbi:unnamed protein product [Rhizoctonia solani]|uniref:F-box domain-containing protein n=1 Tax=Rhizoctonia solani TaxID=456999 RepID=A0A8H2Y1Y7_9AGAM|nr:unnamed protein product [Rhizoctonia solani]
MVTTRSGATSSGNHATTPKRQWKPEATFSPDTSRRRKRARISNVQVNSSGESLKYHGIVDMPEEIFSEIVSRLHPGDLLSLSQTCKLLRDSLMKQSAARIWKSAEGNVPHLPMYPWSDMTPPAYAALLFSKSCTACGKHTLNKLDPYLLVRFCSICREVDLTEISKWDPYTKMFYKLVVKTNIIQLPTKNKARRPPGSGFREYCLSQDLESIRDAYQTLLRVGCNTALRRWKEEQREEVQLRNQFALRLQKILRRLRDLGWKDKEFDMGYNKPWNALVNQPHPLTDRAWTNILPKLIPILEAKRASLEVAAKQQHRKARLDRISTLFELFTLKVHPLASFIRALGFNPELRDTDSNDTTPSVVKFLKSTPFPNVETATKWPWIANVIETDITLQELDNLFCENMIDLSERAFDWRRDIEKPLVLTIFAARTESNDLSLEDVGWEAECELTVGGGQPPITIGLLTRFLLRADTVFCRNNQVSQLKEEFSYYPYLTSTFGSQHWSSDGLITTTVSSYQRHGLAEKATKALLKGLDMVDASYLELAVMGEVFVCESCRMQKAKDWKGMVQHYLDELRSWDVSLLVNPRFKTRHPVDFANAHSISYDRNGAPLIRVVTAQEIADMATAATQPGDPNACIPCKNYARMYVSTNMEAMECHLYKSHFISLPVVEGIHYEPAVGSANFLQSGAEWKHRWDTYYDEHDE